MEYKALITWNEMPKIWTFYLSETDPIPVQLEACIKKKTHTHTWLHTALVVFQTFWVACGLFPEMNRMFVIVNAMPFLLFFTCYSVVRETT